MLYKLSNIVFGLIKSTLASIRHLRNMDDSMIKKKEIKINYHIKALNYPTLLWNSGFSNAHLLIG